jgi:hypothetical protein
MPTEGPPLRAGFPARCSVLGVCAGAAQAARDWIGWLVEVGAIATAGISRRLPAARARLRSAARATKGAVR